jgi:outer membrane protein
VQKTFYMKTIFVLASALLLSLSTFGQSDELKSLVRQSFNYNPRLQELTKTSEINDIKIGIAQSNFLPTINGTASYSYLNPVGQATFPVSATETRVIQFQPNNNYNANIGLNQVIWDFGRTQAQIDKAKADLLATKQNSEAAKGQLASQVASIYYSLIYLQKAITLQDTILAFYQSNRRMVEGKIRQGDALKVDLLNIENSISQEQNRKLEFQRQLDRQLALLTYTTGQNSLPLQNAFDFNQVAMASNVSLQSNPDLLAADQRIASAAADSKLAQRNKLPNLSLQAAAGFRNGYQPDINEIRFNYLAGVTLNVPIFQGRRIRQNILVSQKAVELSEINKNNLTLTLQKDWQSAVADFTTYQQQLTNAKSQVEAAQEALRLTQIRYDRGVATYVDLVFASANYQRSLLNELQLQYQSSLAQTEMARIQGIKFWE